jgi:nucleotide-binding universal stress UspA family protein
MKTLETTSRRPWKNILLGTDLSPASERALYLALNIARHYESKLNTVHVVPPDICPFRPPSEWPNMAREEEQTRNEGRRHLEDALSDVCHEILFERGDVWPTLSRLIRDNGVDLLVVGTHGRTGMVKAVLGSVAEQVFRQAPCDVLTVGQGIPSEAKHAADLKRILYATDFSFESLVAVPYALTLTRAYEAQLILLHVVEQAQTNHISTALQTLRDLVPLGSVLTSKPKCLVEHGKPADTILKVSATEDAHVIVLGVRRVEGPVISATNLIRPTAYKIVAQAACPVLTVRG